MSFKNEFIKRYRKCRPQRKKWFFAVIWRVGLFNSGNGLCGHIPVLQTLAVLRQLWASFSSRTAWSQKQEEQKPGLGQVGSGKKQAIAPSSFLR